MAQEPLHHIDGRFGFSADIAVFTTVRMTYPARDRDRWDAVAVAVTRSMKPAPGWMTWGRGLLLLAMALAAALWPEGRLACSDPDARETSPDHAWTLTLCRRPMWFAMPGNSGGAPGWIVLRDTQGAIRGVVDLSMVQNYRAAAGSPTEWEPGWVRVQLVAELPLVPASGPVARWVEARVWRWRALLGLVPTDDMFR